MSKKVVKILAIDGGGIRGVIPAMVLAQIEKQTGKPTSELFDLVSGASTGGILALTLTVPDKEGRPKFSAEDIVLSYEKDGKDVFTRSFWHRLGALEGLLNQKYTSEGRDELTEHYFAKTNLSEALTEVLIPSYEIELGTPFFFKRRDARTDESLNFAMADIAKATSAAPTYFEPYIIEPTKDPKVKHYCFIDGGVVANNPAMCAYVEAKTLFPEAQKFIIISLGTGEYSEVLIYENFKNWGVTQWLRPLLQIFLGGAGDVVDHQLKTLQATSGDELSDYHRFQIRLHQEESPLDKVTDIGVHTLKLVAENLIQDRKKEIAEICDKLTNDT